MLLLFDMINMYRWGDKDEELLLKNFFLKFLKCEEKKNKLKKSFVVHCFDPVISKKKRFAKCSPFDQMNICTIYYWLKKRRV